MVRNGATTLLHAQSVVNTTGKYKHVEKGTFGHTRLILLLRGKDVGNTMNLANASHRIRFCVCQDTRSCVCQEMRPCVCHVRL